MALLFDRVRPLEHVDSIVEYSPRTQSPLANRPLANRPQIGGYAERLGATAIPVEHATGPGT